MNFPLTLYTATFAILWVPAVLANAILLYLLSAKKSNATLQISSIFRHLLLNLTISDTLALLLSVPFSFYQITLYHWPFGVLLCKLSSANVTVSSTADSYTLTAIGIYWYGLVVRPKRTKLSIRKCAAVIASIWIISMAAALYLHFRYEMATVSYPSYGGNCSM